MLTQSHLVVASCSYLLIIGESVPGLSTALLGAVLPDLDSKQSVVGRLFPPVSRAISYQFGHRTLTHSLMLQSVVGMAWLISGDDLLLALAIGLISHTFADMLTKSGVCWFWPSRVRCVLPGSEKYRFETGSWAELVFAALMAALSFVFVWINYNTAGTGGFVRSVIGDVATAREQYDEKKGSRRFTLRVKGRDNQTHKALEGEFPVIAPYGANGFLLDRHGQAASLCKQGGCNVYPEHAVLVSLEAIQTTSLNWVVNRVHADEFRRKLADIQSIGKVFVSGQYIGPADPDGLTVISENGKVRLYYSDPLKLPTVGVLRKAELRILIEHEPSAKLPDIRFEEQAAEPTDLDVLLKKWMD